MNVSAWFNGTAELTKLQPTHVRNDRGEHQVTIGDERYVSVRAYVTDADCRAIAEAWRVLADELQTRDAAHAASVEARSIPEQVAS